MKIEKLNRKNLKLAARIIKKGGLVIFPSDTVYGLLVNATNRLAVEKLIKFKNRPKGKPISVFVNNFDELKKQVQINHEQQLLLKSLLPGPFTVVLNSKHRVSPLLESEKRTLGIRLINYRPIFELTGLLKYPVTATSANLSGRSSHYSVKSLFKNLSGTKKDLIDLIIDAGQLPRNKPSTIIDLTANNLKVLRSGDVLLNEHQKLVSGSDLQTQKTAQYFIGKYAKSVAKPVVFIIEGELGVGKTVFVKGLGNCFGIRNIISPTFVVYYEYKISQPGFNLFIHGDLYNIQDESEFNYLGLEKYLQLGNVLAFEWGEKIGTIFDLFRKNARVIYIKMKYVNEKEREISFSEVK